MQNSLGANLLNIKAVFERLTRLAGSQEVIHLFVELLWDIRSSGVGPFWTVQGVTAGLPRLRHENRCN